MTGAVYLDLSKAFDLVNHELLLDKLALYHVSPSCLELFRSYLGERRQYVFVNGKRSSEGLIKCGVPQGSILGPLFFTIYINDLPLYLSSRSNVRCSLFADDTTLDVSSSSVSVINESLQSSLDAIGKWCEDNCMKLHPSKTESMLIATRQKLQLHPPPLRLFLNSEPINQVTEHRLLGVTVDSQLSWHEHVERVCKKTL